MTDPILEKLRKGRTMRKYLRVRDQNECDLISKMKDATVDYQGNHYTFKRNKDRAILGGIATLVASFVHPVIGLAAMSYTGVKAYQAYKDHERYRG